MRLLRPVWNFILPPDVSVRTRRLELTIWAFLLSLAYYNELFGFLAWFALARPIILLSRLKANEVFGAAYWFGFWFNAFSLYWVALVTPPGTITAILIVALYYATVLTIFHRIHSWRPLWGFVALPFLWVGMEYFRTLSQFAFPWSELGYTQAYYTFVLQIVSVVSVHGLSLIIVAVNALLAQLFRKDLLPERKLTAVLLTLGTIFLVTAYGWIAIPPYPKDGTVKVALLQGSVPLDVKWAQSGRRQTFELYDSLSQAVEDSNVQLCIWPETSVPCYVSHDYGCRQALGRLAARSGARHLVGTMRAVDTADEQHHFNSAYQFGPDGRLEQAYSKIKLVPFSEQVPYKEYLPFLRPAVLTKYLTFIKTYDVQWWSDFYPGDSMTLFSLPETDYGLLICFESTFPEYARATVRKGAAFLVGITNDTWFKNSVGIYMHARIFVTRAVENRVWGARTANSGISYIVDPYGRIRQQLDYNEVAALVGKVGLLEEESVFTRYGDIAGRLSFLILLGCIGIFTTRWIIALIRRRFSS